MKALPPTLRTTVQQLRGQSTASSTPSMPRKPAWARLWMLRMSPRIPWPPSQVYIINNKLSGSLCRRRTLHSSMAYTVMHAFVCPLFWQLFPFVPSFLQVCIHACIHALTYSSMHACIRLSMHHSSIHVSIHLSMSLTGSFMHPSTQSSIHSCQGSSMYIHE